MSLLRSIIPAVLIITILLLLLLLLFLIVEAQVAKTVLVEIETELFHEALHEVSVHGLLNINVWFGLFTLYRCSRVRPNCRRTIHQ